MANQIQSAPSTTSNQEFVTEAKNQVRWGLKSIFFFEEGFE